MFCSDYRYLNINLRNRMQFITVFIISQGRFEMSRSSDTVKILKMHNICHQGFGHRYNRFIEFSHRHDRFIEFGHRHDHFLLIHREPLQLSSAWIAQQDA